MKTRIKPTGEPGTRYIELLLEDGTVLSGPDFGPDDNDRTVRIAEIFLGPSGVGPIIEMMHKGGNIASVHTLFVQAQSVARETVANDRVIQELQDSEHRVLAEEGPSNA